MSVVLDANTLIVLALDSSRASAVEARLRGWDDAGEALHAPELLRYEAANALARAAMAGQLSASEVTAAWQLELHDPLLSASECPDTS